MKKSIRGTDAEVGFISGWESTSDSVGTGEQEIKKINPYERIDFEVRFIKPFESTSEAYLKTEIETEHTTKVTWVFHGNMPYPSNLMLLTMDMEGMLGKDLHGGLENLKTLLEAQVAIPTNDSIKVN